ncbi:peptidylprolyl isomerase [Paenibacillus sp. FSL W7-1287]|uniref:peptidylprolyl isomerase n=1 Tax=Paenibacillus sp. FSL W7-1287 TaxID=2954538 RepID=UPI0030FC8133
MKKYNVLKVVVIAQAIGMIALTVLFILHYVPYLTTGKDNSEAQQMTGSSDAEDEEVIAVIADHQITKQQLINELLELYGDRELEQMLIHHAIELAAEEKGITLSADELSQAIKEAASGYENEESYFELMRSQLGLSQQRVVADIADHALLMKIITASANISEQEVNDYIAEHMEELMPKQRLDLSWILSPTYEDADKVMQLLHKGNLFSDLAKSFSIDPYSAEQGGSLGEIESDDPFYDERMLQEAMQLNVGDIVGPIEISEGYAIIQLLGRQIENEKSEEAIREWARKQLALQQIGSLSEAKQQLLNQYVTVIRK